MPAGDDWLDLLKADPRPWLLDDSTPAVRAAALQRLMGREAGDPDVVEARRRAMETDPIRAILDAQDPAGWWVKPGPGYGPKYRSTVWNLMFLEQLGADPAESRVAAGVDYLLRIVPTAAGGFGCSGSHLETPPPPSSVLHCLNGNLLRAFIVFGRLDDPRVQAAIEWEARAITGDGMPHWYASTTSGPGFQCGINDHLPCAWGAVKALRGLAAIPTAHRSALVAAAIEAGVEFLLSRNPAVADYPMGWGDTKPSPNWFKLGFPSGYVADVLQVLEALAELAHGPDRRLAAALDWLLARQDDEGRWLNRYAYHGKTTVDI
ncbi:MAG: nitrogen fixation protein NifH, partial [Actinobacteria bacterium]|nr:nitrogen fixation protein NifH [Actinomycetota bacterium]